jgi:hypothetical protein
VAVVTVIQDEWRGPVTCCQYELTVKLSEASIFRSKNLIATLLLQNVTFLPTMILYLHLMCPFLPFSSPAFYLFTVHFPFLYPPSFLFHICASSVLSFL